MLPPPRFAVTGASAQVDRSTCWHTPVVQAREMRAIQKGRAKVKCLLRPDLQTWNERAGRPVYLLAPPGHGDPGRAHKSLVPESGMTKTRNTETNKHPQKRKSLKPEKLVSVPPSLIHFCLCGNAANPQTGHIRTIFEQYPDIFGSYLDIFGP